MNRLTASILCVVAVACVPALAEQAPDPAQLQPVDQAVSDIDPMVNSLRVVEKGLSYLGDQSRLYKPVSLNVVDTPAAHSIALAPVNSVYYRTGPGYLVRVPRVNYLVRWPTGDITSNQTPGVDGQYREIIPNDMVYLIDQIPLRSELTVTYNPVPPSEDRSINSRVDPQRLDLRVDRRVDMRVEARKVEPSPAFNP